MKLIEGYLSAFIAIQMNPPALTFYTSSVRYALQAVKLHLRKVDGIEYSNTQKAYKKLKYLIQNTHKDLLLPLHAVEVKVAITDFSRWGDTTDMVDNNGKPLSDLTVYRMFLRLTESYEDVIDVVTEVGENYSVEIPSSGFLTPSGSQTSLYQKRE